jgi:hypothetical protein
MQNVWPGIEAKKINFYARDTEKTGFKRLFLKIMLLEMILLYHWAELPII